MTSSKERPSKLPLRKISRVCKQNRIRFYFQKNKKQVKIQSFKITAIQEHLLLCKYSPTLEDFSILTRESNDFKLEIMDILLIARDKPRFNKADSSLPLELFRYNIGSYYIMFCHIIRCPPIPLRVYNCRSFSFQYYVTSFLFYQKQNVWALNIILGVTM